MTLKPWQKTAKDSLNTVQFTPPQAAPATDQSDLLTAELTADIGQANAQANEQARADNTPLEPLTIAAEPVHTPPLKKQQVFDATELKLDLAQEELKGPQAFTAETPVQELTDIDALVDERLCGAPNQLDANVLAPKARSSGRWSWPSRLALLSLLLLVLVQTALGLKAAWVESPWLFSFYGLVLGMVSTWAVAGALAEYRKLKRLKQVADTQASSARLCQSMQMGEADGFIQQIVAHYEDSQGLRQLRQSLTAEHNDAEKILLFETLVLTERDALARKVVRRYAAESALLLAASPLAALDMAIILWRNQRMLQEVARCYGIELGYWSRIRLIRSIIINIIYAGSSELVADLGSQLLS
ncbi:MAG: TIGR01620 family protein, partial [Shewanella sp.]